MNLVDLFLTLAVTLTVSISAQGKGEFPSSVPD